MQTFSFSSESIHTAQIVQLLRPPPRLISKPGRHTPKPQLTTCILFSAVSLKSKHDGTATLTTLYLTNLLPKTHVEERCWTETLTVTISSQLRIQSILSPENPDADDPVNTPENVQSSKRAYEDAFNTTADRARDPTSQSRGPQPASSPPHPVARSPQISVASQHSPDSQSKPRKPLVSSACRVSVDDGRKSVSETGIMDGQNPRTKMRQPMRSSIACMRCRKSKIKCDNDGGSNACDGCIKSGHECRYSEPSANSVKRSEPPTVKQERDTSGTGSSWNQPGHDRKRFKRVDEMVKLENERAPRYAEDALSSSFLTEDLWDSLFSIYKLHFATELPFLHIPTLREKINEKGRAHKSDDRSTSINLVLLGVLTLTARFHQDLVRYIGNQVNPGTGSARSRPVHTKFEPTQASEYYAEVLTKALGPLRTCFTELCMERVQAFLMLGLYEWTKASPETGGAGAWMFVGNAIRMAQALGLGVGDKPDPSINARRAASVGTPVPRQTSLSADIVIEKEIRRRTMFSCLILDRMTSCGKDRVPMIQSGDLQIQLPCSEDAFDLSKDVFTGFLDETSAPHLERLIRDDSVLGRFIKLVDLWGDISKFSFSGGRLNEIHPPWDERTTFYKLSLKLAQFFDELPPTFCLSKQNYYRHDNHQASSVFVSLHMLGSVCRIMLHREYIPYIPIRCDKPCGPLDAPRFPAEEYDIPEGFWDTSADQVFIGARDIVDLIRMCQKREKDNLPQSSLAVFSVWSAAFVGIYAYHFPHLDVPRRMLEKFDDNEAGDVTDSGPTAVALQTLRKLSQYNKIAATYMKHFHRCNQFYQGAKRDFEKATTEQVQEDGKPRLLSIRHGGQGGGLEEWKRDRVDITNYGTILPTVSVDADFKNETGEYQPGAYPPRSVDRGSETEPEYNMSIDSGSPSRASAPSFKAINSKPVVPPMDQDKVQSMARQALHQTSYGDEAESSTTNMSATRFQPHFQDNFNVDGIPDQTLAFQYTQYQEFEGARFAEDVSTLGSNLNIGGEFFPHWFIGSTDHYMHTVDPVQAAPFVFHSPVETARKETRRDDLREARPPASDQGWMAKGDIMPHPNCACALQDEQQWGVGKHLATLANNSTKTLEFNTMIQWQNTGRYYGFMFELDLNAASAK
ncbi:hypothetical protein MKZ38_005305 [Zalerion maritima]|uniref:Zn(2)-C6 fungal-type domain-containing protein n=1 Tax=Zalerion maritima TaxID=339359 RepID=A0AAD5WQF5_9PEZI|nr:hypothetical protein MKZ38_005305 [Zalerion maritima]